MVRATRLFQFAFVSIFAVSACSYGAGQDSSQGSPPKIKPQEPVIKVSVKLVQVDATVTDEKGHAVRDLTAKDFEILQDGKLQIITNFSYVNTTVNVSPVRRAETTATAGKVRFEDIHRTIALVVDDIGLSFEDTARIRQSLEHYVDQEMQPGDLVSIVRTSSGMSSLQQFTTDKRILHAAIKELRFNLIGGGPLGAFSPVDSHNANFPQGGNSPSGANIGGRNGAGQFASGYADSEYRLNFVAGSLGAVRAIVDGLQSLPGRKVLVLFSENAQIFFNRQPSGRVQYALQKLIDAANRSAVVIYTIDPGGLRYNGLLAADDTVMDNPQTLTTIPIRRSNQEYREREGLIALAQATGGLFSGNSNDLNGELRGELEDSAGYYLIGYRPEASTFDAKTGRTQFHSLRVRVVRQGLKVRSRSGFFGVEDGDTQDTSGSPQEMMLRSMMSPFSSGDLHVRLTALFKVDDKVGPVLDAMLYIDTHELKFRTDPDGTRRATLEAMAAIFNENGQASETSGKQFVMEAKDDKEYAELMQSGLVFVMQYPTKKSGPYQMRVAVRDVNTNLVGSANEFIEVPHLRSGHIALSSILLTSGNEVKSSETASAEESGKVRTDTPAVRTFRPDESIVYLFQVLNAHTSKDRQTDIEAQVTLFRNGDAIFTTTPGPPAMVESSTPERLICGGVLKLGRKMAPGDYVLQVAISDQEGRHTRVTQAVDFQVE